MDYYSVDRIRSGVVICAAMKRGQQADSITTRCGDGGQTRLLAGQKVYKDDARLEVLGDLDELVAALGIVRAQKRSARERHRLLMIQRALFVLGSEVAASPDGHAKLAHRLGREDIALLDRWCAEAEALGYPHDFVVPGASIIAAQIDWVRCVCRRCERHLVRLVRRKLFCNRYALAWINRLSDYLWLLARAKERKATLLKPSPRS